MDFLWIAVLIYMDFLWIGIIKMQIISYMCNLSFFTFFGVITDKGKQEIILSL